MSSIGMEYAGKYISDGLKAIAKAIETASANQGKPISYNIIVNVGPDTDREDVAKSVVEAIKKADEKTRRSAR